MTEPADLNCENIKEYHNALLRVKKEIQKVIVGHSEIIDGVLISVLTGGHVLLEGVPGLGKTMLVQTLGQVLDLDYSRIQFTPDLMPADITGTNILMEDAVGKRYFDFQEGPLFAQLILADEINRATPKTQSALLEAMQERTISVAGQTRELKRPFLVLATQNPLEMEGTYPLPEAQIDRFFLKLKVGYPDSEELKKIITRTSISELPVPDTILSSQKIIKLQKVIFEIPVASPIIDYAVRLVMSTQPQYDDAPEIISKYVHCGSSPRGAQALIRASKARAFLTGRYNVSFEDIKTAAPSALRHRIILNFEGEAEEIDTDELIYELINKVPEKE